MDEAGSYPTQGEEISLWDLTKAAEIEEEAIQRLQWEKILSWDALERDVEVAAGGWD